MMEFLRSWRRHTGSEGRKRREAGIRDDLSVVLYRNSEAHDNFREALTQLTRARAALADKEKDANDDR